ncbi:glycoside hydrolase family 3 N-terminal domain-containing protein [Catenulispora yoronensis]|uniref:Glycoside hydrolase family 3 N-terminal domain-containing protein n=1 Tax=Catenulispora yoronensis TaxID=450799 RepID=A0ABN2U0Q3_9ACTN
MTDHHTPAERPWTDPTRPTAERVAALSAAMSLEEKLAQLGSIWPGVKELLPPEDPEAATQNAGGQVAPMQEMFGRRVDFVEGTRHGLGHLTRPLGTKPVEPTDGAKQLAEWQRDLMTRTRLGIPALAHEECLTGFTAYRATVFPTSIAWAAAFDPESVQEMARAIGEGMRAVGVHQGLSPVLDVVRDYRWGRVEETLGEDPYLASVTGTAYVTGLESAGVVATLKHFAGYSASRGARNHGPVSMGRREFRDVILPPFEAALREGGARSVMNSYSDVDGVPAAADAWLLTDLLRGELGFDGTVVSDYWAIAFLRVLHGVTEDWGDSAARALEAGIDVELPGTLCYGSPLHEKILAGSVSEALVDRALERVLRQKVELGLLDADWAPEDAPALISGDLDLDSPESRDIARKLAERSVVLLDNTSGVLPLAASGLSRIAVVGPCADDANAFFGCYSFPNHVLPHYTGMDNGIEAATFLQALRTELSADGPGPETVFEVGCPVRDEDRSGIAAAAEAAASADLCIAVIGDRAALFGGGTSGEGCDVEDLALPGVQHELLEAVLATGTPTVVVAVTGRPYALGPYVGRAAAIVQAFFPGEEGGPALAGILSGRVTPSGKLPVQIPARPGGQPTTYLHPRLGAHATTTSSLDTTPAFPFGHGLSYTEFAYSELELSATEVPTDGAVEVSVTVSNTGAREGAEVVQLYAHDPIAQVTRPVTELVGFARVPLAPGESARVSFQLHTDRLSFTGLDMTRIVEPGEVRLSVGSSSSDLRARASVSLTGSTRTVAGDRVLTTPAVVRTLGGATPAVMRTLGGATA